MQPPSATHLFHVLVAYYVVYPILCAAIVVLLQIVLHRAGALFLSESFPTNPGMATSIRRLLDIGYYLVCAGYFLISVHTSQYEADTGSIIEMVSVKVGLFLLLLGVLHVFNLLLLALFRNRKPTAQPAP